MTKSTGHTSVVPIKSLPKKEFESTIVDKKVLPALLYNLYTTLSPYPDEKQISDLIIASLPRTKGKKLRKDVDYTVDTYGNVIVTVGERAKITTMFSSHIDIVHIPSKDVSNFDLKKDRTILYTQHEKTKKPMEIIGDRVWAGYYLYKDLTTGLTMYEPTTLGADDKTGVYIMLKLIAAKIPALYIFHSGEEKGGIGSTQIISKTPKIVEGIERAIAFDRMNYADIITTQRGGQCCSQSFSFKLAEQLNSLIPAPKIRFKNAIGSFTDTANYVGLISECTNLSVGYFNQHTKQESQDVYWLLRMLLPTLLKINWDSLPTCRALTKNKILSAQYKLNRKNNLPYTYNNTHLVAFRDATLMTQPHNMPEWSFKMGYVKEVMSDAVFNKIISTSLAEKINKSSYTNLKTLYSSDIPYTFVSELIAYLKANDKIKDELEQLKKSINTFENWPVNKTESNSGAKNTQQELALILLLKTKHSISSFMHIYSKPRIKIARLLARDIRVYLKIIERLSNINPIENLIHDLLTRGCVFMSQLHALPLTVAEENKTVLLHTDLFQFLVGTWEWNNNSKFQHSFAAHHSTLVINQKEFIKSQLRTQNNA